MVKTKRPGQLDDAKKKKEAEEKNKAKKFISGASASISGEKKDQVRFSVNLSCEAYEKLKHEAEVSKRAISRMAEWYIEMGVESGINERSRDEYLRFIKPDRSKENQLEF